MFKNVLVPTDGSPLSAKAVKAAVRLAARLGAQVTGVYVLPVNYDRFYTEGVTYLPRLQADQLRAATKREGQKALGHIEAAARAGGVRYAPAMLAAATPWEGILKAAKAKRCDLVVMASHGRRGLAGLLLGSETAKVLTHSKIPVLVCR
jgi:nucleotide-binding universal stress UspA family protein